MDKALPDLHIVKSLDWIGQQGPLILFFITTVNLFQYKKYLLAYLVFSCINHFLNPILKVIIKEQRPGVKIERAPDLDTRIKEFAEDRYGMPSYHAQTVFFYTVFLYLVVKKPYLLIGELTICFLTLHQRWKYERHDLRQLTVGAIIGTGVAYGSYYLTNYYLTTQ
jgi:membrane-associated phospholipid phosphatase